MHQSYQTDPYDLCEQLGCYFIAVNQVGDLTNFRCDRCGESMTLCSQAEDDFAYAWGNFGIYLYG